MPATRSELQRKPRTGHEVDAVGHVPAGNSIREAAERLRSAGTTVDEEFDVSATKNSEW